MTPGTKLGLYEIGALLGAGGMGEVYRAKDTKLGRDVALKILPASFTTDPERVARFRREAQVLASLNHAHIGAIYGLEEANGTQFLVLELVDGESLDKRIAGDPIPVDETLGIAKQIAEALEAAHEKGIIHRDLKPANIALTADGTVKVLDFGLAKPVESTSGSVDAMSSPTITSPAMMTGVGVMLGTAAYMSPEQAKGRAADKRSDIWAFGCVLYELLTGTRAFNGENVSDTLAAVLRSEPDWTAIPATVPLYVRTLVRHCLEQNRAARIADLAVVRFVLAQGATLGGGADTGATVPVETIRGWRRALPWFGASAAFASGVALVLGLGSRVHQQRPAPTLRVSVELGADVSLANTGAGSAVILSPDGTVLAFVGQQRLGRSAQLYVRRLAQLQAVPLPGTDDAWDPFFSPDGQWIAFFTAGKLKKVAVAGGAVVTLCDAPNGRGGTWAEDGTIVFTPNVGPAGRLLRVSSSGGTPAQLTALSEGEVTQRWPYVFPGGQAVLFTSIRTPGAVNNADLVVQSLSSGNRKVVVRGGYDGRYVPSGHLVYVHDGTLWAAPFDLNRLAVTGPPVPTIEGLSVSAGDDGAGFAQVAVASDMLAYVPGPSAGGGPIDWMDRNGTLTPLRSTPANWFNLAIAPDGHRLALEIRDGQSDIWVYEWARDTLTRLTADPSAAIKPVWTPDGRRLVFASTRGDKATLNLYWQRADGVGDAQRLTESRNPQRPNSWHPSGRFLAFEELNPQSSYDLKILPMMGDEASGWRPGTPAVFLSTPFGEREPMFSPDGHWIAYWSNESGRNEVYVRPFPGPGGKWQVSTDGGMYPTWSRTTRELLYGSTTGQIMVAAYAADGDSFRAEKPQPWSGGRFKQSGPARMFDLHPDGNRVALASASSASDGARRDHVTVIFNFFDELNRIAPRDKR